MVTSLGLFVYKSCNHSSSWTERNANPRLDCSAGRVSVKGNAPAILKKDVRFGDVLNLFVRSFRVNGSFWLGGSFEN